jgi:hypothetical protein
LRTLRNFAIFSLVLLASVKQSAQHRSQLFVEVNHETNTLNIEQDIRFVNNTTDSLSTIVLNDWNNAYANVNTPLAKRFSDEFYRGFHLSNPEERGSTYSISILNDANLFLDWRRTPEHPDVITIALRQKLAPNQEILLHLTYNVKIPSDKFTKYGYNNTGNMNLKNWFMTPARYENHHFVTYSNENLDDIANAPSDFAIEMKVGKKFAVTTDLDTDKAIEKDTYTLHQFTGKNRADFSIFIEPKASFYSFKTNNLEVVTNIKDENLSTIQQARVIDCVSLFVEDLIGKYPNKKIIISQTDYDRNPFYGLNQLPSFMRPFSDEFTYELKFLKTYLNAFLKNSLKINNRKDSWVFDGIQVYAMMKYIEKNHPNSKMLGSASTFKLLKSFTLAQLDFNEQYSYFYMLMARKNLDQPLENPKNSLIKFNEQIASKYRAGLSLRCLDSYLGQEVIPQSILAFYNQNQQQQVSALEFETLLKSKAHKNIDWFFNSVIKSRQIVDYKISSVVKTTDSVSFTLKNKTGLFVPIPIYGIKEGEIVFKKWLEPKTNDSSYTLDVKAADKLVLNYKNEVPEYNLRNNWKSLTGFFPNNRPIKFAFMKDIEDPYYNQILYVPTLTYNLYDGLIPGMRLHNKTLLDKPFTFDVNPSYSTLTKNIAGSGYIAINQNYRESRLFNVRYLLSGTYLHYAPDAFYTTINPTVVLKIRESDFRDNKKQNIVFRQVFVNKEKSAFVVNNGAEKYSVFNAKYYNARTEVTNHTGFITDLQLANNFGKLAAEFGYRNLFENNHQINFRFYAGTFLYNKTKDDYYSFALDRPTDYLFDYNYYGRSENSGFFSQQLIIAEGGFKSKLDTPYANQWMTTMNASYNIWNWLEVYGDAGFLKNKNQSAQYAFDSGIRLNLVTDYFELYLPVYSTNGWEVAQPKYNEKIRFIITLSPKILINLFNRKWF